ncbi:hypothetical protein [Granulicella aggregans]|uniref:hypothetical protein n=1 Tax=Granulicella aggregans TaxID=474949 RepID=UPI0021E0254D|nr:hypothetical protein [Granulicella aggregans]
MKPGQSKEPIAGFGQWHSTPQVNQRGSYSYALDLIRESVVFLYTDGGGVRMTPHGTGFLIDVPSKTRPGTKYTFLITARHLVDADWTGGPQVADRLLMRMNRKGPLVLEIGEPATVFYPLKEQAWFHPEADSIDIAFTMIPKENLVALGANVQPLGSDALASQVEADSMRVGDETVSAGLLSGVSGNLANYPIFKWGNVSSFHGEPIPTKMPGGKILNLFEALVSASLVQGNSGSPIFVLPNERHPHRMFLAGVQSMSYIGNDVAGMAPIRSLIDSLHKLKDQPDIDLGPPDQPPVLSP